MLVWQEAMALAEEVFRLTEKLPRKEDYGLTSQIRRSALSISANIAEAFGRCFVLEKVDFHYFAGARLPKRRAIWTTPNGWDT